MSCHSPSAVACAWGKAGGPCGGSRPYKKDCDDGLVCAGATADTEGTCVSPGTTLLNPGDPCDDEMSKHTCPWNFWCTAPIPPSATRSCSEMVNCALDISQPTVSAATITVNGDGPTQRYDFVGPFQYGFDVTGEANAVVITNTSNPSLVGIEINGCPSSSGDPSQGTINIVARFYSTSGPPMTEGMTDGFVRYTAPYVNGVSAGEFMNANPNLPDSPGSVSITVSEINADLVQGSYDAVLPSLDDSDTRHLTGTFAVCRLPDRVNP